MILFIIGAVVIFYLLFIYWRYKSYVPILMYHRIADNPGDRNSLPVAKLKEQLAYLAANNFTTITPTELYEHLANGAKLPTKPVLLTFDDGYADNYTTAMPLLQQYNMTAVVFPIANWLGKENKWENYHKEPTRTMTAVELKDWLAKGFCIEGHTASHPFLTGCDDAGFKAELGEAKASLSQQIGKPIDFICYPYGFFNEAVMAAAKQYGYKAGFAIFDNVPLYPLNLYALPRIPVPAKQKLWEFKLKVSSIHMIFVAMRKWERVIKKIRPRK